MISEIPVPTPVGAVRIGQDAEGNFLVNPDEEWLLESPLDLVVAGTEEAILMVEAGASEITEAEILDALDIAHQEIKRLCEAQHDLRKQAGKDKVEITPPQVDESIMSQVPPGFTRALGQRIRALRPSLTFSLYYWVETLIFGDAVRRALTPERYMIGCDDPRQPIAPALDVIGMPFHVV
jgi:polyribonucleotide nucleotidyltransferase